MITFGTPQGLGVAISLDKCITAFIAVKAADWKLYYFWV